MSILTMNINPDSKMALNDGGVDNLTGEVVAPSGERVLGADFKVDVIGRYGAKVYKRSAYFTVVAEDGDGGIAGLLDAAARISSDICALSEGVINGLWMKIGKYRNDELPGLINAAVRRVGILTLTNALTADVCATPDAVIPRRTVTSTVRIPWFAPGQSDQDLEVTLNKTYATDDGNFHIGSFRFTDDVKDAMEAFITDNVKFKEVKQDSKPSSFGLIVDDEDLGFLGDDVISENMHDVYEGDDDTLPPPAPGYIDEGGGSGGDSEDEDGD